MAALTTIVRTSVTATTIARLAFGGVACASAEPASAPTPTPTTTVDAVPIAIKDPWVKTAESGMSAAYGTLMNTSGTEIVVVSATSTASSMMELHEIATVDGKMVMRPKAGGFVIPANGTHELKPGGDHLMLMNVTTAVKPGDTVTVTLTLDDGCTTQFSAVGKDFAGGNETYSPGMTMSPMS